MQLGNIWLRLNIFQLTPINSIRHHGPRQVELMNFIWWGDIWDRKFEEQISVLVDVSGSRRLQSVFELLVILNVSRLINLDIFNPIGRNCVELPRSNRKRKTCKRLSWLLDVGALFFTPNTLISQQQTLHSLDSTIHIHTRETRLLFNEDIKIINILFPLDIYLRFILPHLRRRITLLSHSHARINSGMMLSLARFDCARTAVIYSIMSKSVVISAYLISLGLLHIDHRCISTVLHSATSFAAISSDFVSGT